MATEYCTDGDVRNRLTDNGRMWVADRDQNGAVSAAEQAQNISEAIVWAGTKIDAAIVNRVNSVTARASGNLYLRHLCKDLAVWYALTPGGRETPSDSVMLAFKMALMELERLAGGGDIPGYVYPVPINSLAVTRTPKVKNWSTCCGGNCGTRIWRR